MTDARKLPKPKFRPLRDRILIIQDDAEEKSAGGIIMPHASVKPPSQGTVIAVGSGQHTESGVLIPVDLKRGDRVVYGAHAGHAIKMDDVDYVVITSNDVLGVI